MSATATQPLRDEHQELLPNIESLRTAGDAVGTETVEARQIFEAMEAAAKVAKAQ